MKNETIKFYWGKMTLPFGVPFIIVAGWEESGEYHCERFVIFEQFRSAPAKRGMKTKITQIDFKLICDLTGEKASLENFMKREGKLMAEHDIFSIIADLNEILKPTTFSGTIHNEIAEIKTANWISILYNLNRKHKTAVDWVYKNTKSKLLKNQIDVIRKLKITSTSC